MTSSPNSDRQAVRDAATVIVLREIGDRPHVLMGQRGASAAFMPNKFVFPGGALDADDHGVPLGGRPSAICLERLCAQSDPALADALVLAAIREVWEETGLLIGRRVGAARRHADTVPASWHGFFADGVLPDGAGMRFVFRAITPPGRPRRFDARFFTVDAGHLVGDPDDFSHASHELSHLQWIPLCEARRFDLPFITEVVLAEVEADLAMPERDAKVPFFFNAEGRSNFLRL